MLIYEIYVNFLPLLSVTYITHTVYKKQSYISLSASLILLKKRLLFILDDTCWHNYAQEPCWSPSLNAAYTVTILTALGQRSVSSLCLYSGYKVTIKLQPLEYLQMDSSRRRKYSCQNLSPFEICYWTALLWDFSESLYNYDNFWVSK